MKIKKMADGGTTPGTQQPTYPFYGNQQTQATTTPRVVQNVNIPQPGFPLSQPMNTSGQPAAMKKGGKVKKMAKGGSASSRADGIAQRGKTRGRVL
jgi:hypothetical protein